MSSDVLVQEESPDGGSGATDRALGKRVKALRRARGLSLQQLSEAAGLSIGFVSQIERGMSSPSLRTLVKLADVLAVGVGELFSDVDRQLDEEGGIVARSFDHRPVPVPASLMAKRWLTPFARVPRLDLYIVDLEAGGDSGERAYVHEGEEAGYVIQGGLELMVDSRRYILGEGDSFRFASSRPHRFANAGPRHCRVLWVNYRETGSNLVTPVDSD